MLVIDLSQNQCSLKNKPISKWLLSRGGISRRDKPSKYYDSIIGSNSKGIISTWKSVKHLRAIVFLAGLHEIFHIHQSVVWEFSTSLLIIINDFSQTAEINIGCIVCSIQFEFLIKGFEGWVVSFHWGHFLHHFLEDFRRVLPCVYGRERLQSHSPAVHLGNLGLGLLSHSTDGLNSP